MTRPSLKKILPTQRRKSSDSGEKVTMKPLFAEGLPLLIEPAMDGLDLIAWAGNHRDLLTEKLYHHGAILFRGFGINQPGMMESFIGSISGETLEYRERSSPRHQVEGNIYTSTDYPASQSIFPHNENSYQFTWPMKLFFQCVTPSQTGGETPLVDCRKVLERIDPAIVARFRQQGVLYIRNFSEALGLPWQTVFQTQNKAEVEQYCQERGIQVEWKPDGGLRTRSVRQAVARHPFDGKETWFNHGTFFHVTTLESSIAEGLMSSMAEEDLPSQTFYGDGTPIEASTLDHLRAAYAAAMVLFPWQRGDLAMIDNMYTAHARSPFTGERQILVGMSEPMDGETLERHLKARIS